MKKLLLVIAAIMILYGLYGLLFDRKYRCESQGGSYHAQTKECRPAAH